MTLDDLIALNDEIAALVRAGVPLEQGLAALGGDLPGRMGQVAALLAERTARGEPLAQVVMDHTMGFPPAYRAVVEAGIKAGRLPAALEAVAGSARRLTETHRAAVIAAIYPLLVFALAWGCLVFFARVIAPSLAATFLALGVPGHRFFVTVAWIGRGSWYWGPVVPVAAVLFLAAWWFASTRASVLHSRSSDWLLGWLPWMGPMLRWSRSAAFLEVLALLVENRVPLDDAIRLAADASGDPRTLPPLVNWLMLAAGRDGALLPALRHAAETYRRRARHQSDLVRIFLPVVLTVCVGGSATLVYAVALFGPYAAMLRWLAGG
jgi:general secretion pathway protein F